MKEEIINILIKQTGLDRELTNKLFNLCTPINVTPKTLLSNPEIKCRKAVYVTSGIVKHYCLGKKGEEIVLNFRAGPGFIVYSLSGFFRNKLGQTYCEALTTLEGYQVDAEDLMNLANEYPSIYQFLLTAVTRVYQQRQIKEFSILEKSSKERYIDFAQSYSEFLDIIPLKSIASFLNIQPGSLSRLRKELNT